HGRQLHAVGDTGYESNMLTLTGMAQWMTVAFLPELRDAETWEEQFWPRYEAGYRRDLLPDGTHEHRAFGYHLTYVYRGLSVLALARMLGTESTIPEGFRELVGQATDAFAAIISPIRSTPGVNDDWEIRTDYRHVLFLGADLYGRPDWRHLATDGQQGKPPRERSTLLPDGQLAVMRSGWSKEARWLFFNVSPEGGHHHCDTLGIQIWAGGRQLLVEPYKGDYTFERDVYNRSWWHSTPTLGETLLPLRPEPKVLHWETSPKLDYAIGQITVPVGDDATPATIRRHIFHVDRRFWVVWDEFEDVPDGQVIWENFHFPTRDLNCGDDGRSVVTALPDSPNLLLRVGQHGWAMQKEDTRMWPVSSRDTLPTATLHYEAGPDTAARGFAALLLPFEGRKPPSTARVDEIERLSGGRVRLRVSVAGGTRVLTTLGPEGSDLK
ncbi:MAG TPA: heparinase II/III family protein, partial [Armatimonadota bacterium]|nr:heparinase II/III family protein [Armatimonadota bacterium]